MNAKPPKPAPVPTLSVSIFPRLPHCLQRRPATRPPSLRTHRPPCQIHTPYQRQINREEQKRTVFSRSPTTHALPGTHHLPFHTNTARPHKASTVFGFWGLDAEEGVYVVVRSLTDFVHRGRRPRRTGADGGPLLKIFCGVYHSTGAGRDRIAAGRPGPGQRRPASGVQQAGGRHGMTCGRALDGRHSRFARVGHQTGLKYSRLCALSTI